MISHIDQDEQTVGRDDRDLIADNLQRIKDSIYGGGGGGEIPELPRRDRDD